MSPCKLPMLLPPLDRVAEELTLAEVGGTAKTYI